MRKTLASVLLISLFALGFPQDFLEILNPPKPVVIESPLSVPVRAIESVSVTLWLNDVVLEKVSIGTGQTHEFKIFLDRARNNEIKFEVENNDKKQIVIFEVTYLPKVHAVVDRDFPGENGEPVNGIPHFNSVQKAVDYFKGRQNNDEKIYVFVKSGDYYEKITIDVSNLSLIGEDVYKTRL